MDIHELFLTSGREAGPDALYRMGFHEIQMIREALHSAEDLLTRLTPLRRRGPRRTKTKVP